MATPRICSIPDCGKEAKRGALCYAHYGRKRRHGDPLGGSTAMGEPLRYFNEIVLSYEGDDCLPWPFSKVQGYGSVVIDGRSKYVSRLICEAQYGPCPPGHEAAHSCGNGHLGCSTKRHLSWKTHAENEKDKLQHGTTGFGQKNGRAKITEKEVREIRALRGSISQKQIGLMFSISQATVGEIQRRTIWAWCD